MLRSSPAGLLMLVSLLRPALVIADDTVDQLCDQARTAYRSGEKAEADRLLDRAIQLDARDDQPHLLRAAFRIAEKQHSDAIVALDRVIELDPKLPLPWDLRGSERFKLGDMTGAIADFDKYLELEPAQMSGHWRRGIAYYYAGRYDDGAKQFAGYQTVDANDVENATWRFLCMARGQSVEAARKELLPIGNDARVPMMEIYALFRGTGTADEVLKAAEQGPPGKLRGQQFFAHLYLGLYYEATGDAKLAAEHIKLAAEKYARDDYMSDVARVHAKLLQKAAK